MTETDTHQRRKSFAIRERAPERRRRALLDSAIVEFSTHGIGGARVDRICERASTNKATLYKNFGSKEQLYLAAMKDIYKGIRDAEEEAAFESDDPLSSLEKLVEFTFRYYIEHPAFVRMINTENLHGAAHVRSDKDLPVLNWPIIDRVAGILEKGVAQGLFRAGLDPLDLYISITALGFTYVSNRHTLEVLFGRSLLADDAVENRLATMKEMILRYVGR